MEVRFYRAYIGRNHERPIPRFFRGLFDSCISTKSPVFSQSQFQWDRGRTLDTIRLILPFSKAEEPDDVGFVLVGQSFSFDEPGPEWPTILQLKDGVFVELSRAVLNEAI